MISKTQENTIIKVLRPFDPQMVGVFGSYARNEQNPGSDLDILVDFKQTVNLLDIIGLEMELSEKLGIKVDLVTKRAVSPRLASSIHKDLQRIL